LKKILIMPLLAGVLFAGACAEDGPTQVEADTRPSVRFFNATTGNTGNGGFTTNGQFATGSAIAFGQSTSTCSKVDAGATTFGFGAANTGGTALTGSTLATLANQTITTGGNYIVVATGPATSPTLFMLDNSYTGVTLATNQAAFRFVNLVEAPATDTNNFAVFSGVFGVDATFIAQQLVTGTPTSWRITTSGSQKFSMLRNHEEPPAVPEVTFNLQAGSANTIAVVTKPSGGYQLIHIPSCS
jgi:hypothetical protein